MPLSAKHAATATVCYNSVLIGRTVLSRQGPIAVLSECAQKEDLTVAGTPVMKATSLLLELTRTPSTQSSW